MFFYLIESITLLTGSLAVDKTKFQLLHIIRYLNPNVRLRDNEIKACYDYMLQCNNDLFTIFTET